METAAPTDAELLADWLAHRRESAFHALVSRYAALVHMAAKRACDDDSLAAEASQLTFILLARKAKSLGSRPSLGGWLHLTAVGEAKNLLRSSRRESRKRALLHTTMDTRTPDPPDESWREIQPFLNDALAALSDKDREALLLRFYRSLSIREIAATLGIATDAAQKRIDRATERLRGKLARRGVQAGGSLSAAMLAGFAADSQAAVLPVSLLATKAIAAGTISSGLISTTSTIMSAVTTKTSYIAALLAVGVWIASQRHSIGELERQNALFQKVLTSGTAGVSVPVKRAAVVTTALDKKPIDWEEVARQLRSAGGTASYLETNRRLRLRLEEGFRALGLQELVAALDEIAASALSARDREILEEKLGTLLMEKDPAVGMTRFIARVHEGDSDRFMGILSYGLGRWAKSDPARAVAWFDKQIAAGEFETNYSGGNSYARILFEKRLIYALLSSAPGSAGSRLAPFPEDQRIEVLKEAGLGTTLRGNIGIQRAFADMLRQQLPEKDRLGLIAWPVGYLGEGGTVEYTELKDYLARIEATPAERESCILRVAGDTFPRKSGSWFKTTNEDLDALRAWVTAEAPELADRAIVRALTGFSRTIPYPEAAAFALHCHETSGRDEELLPLLESDHAEENKELARTLAAKLSDAELRGKYLEKFK